MANSETLQSCLDAIARKFIHRKNPDPARGYSSLEELCSDIDNARNLLDALELKKRLDLSEAWLRTINDLVSYCEDWPLVSSEQNSVSKCVECINSFDTYLCKRFESFTVTQRTRIFSIALRARQATMESVLLGVVDKFGSTMTLPE